MPPGPQTAGIPNKAEEIDQERIRAFGRDANEAFVTLIQTPPSDGELEDLRQTVTIRKARPMITKIINGADPEAVAAKNGVSLEMVVRRAALIKLDFQNKLHELKLEEDAKTLEG